jgi:hypothetical protein
MFTALCRRGSSSEISGLSARLLNIVLKVELNVLRNYSFWNGRHMMLAGMDKTLIPYPSIPAFGNANVTACFVGLWQMTLA